MLLNYVVNATLQCFTLVGIGFGALWLLRRSAPLTLYRIAVAVLLMCVMGPAAAALMPRAVQAQVASPSEVAAVQSRDESEAVFLPAVKTITKGPIADRAALLYLCVVGLRLMCLARGG